MKHALMEPSARNPYFFCSPRFLDALVLFAASASFSFLFYPAGYQVKGCTPINASILELVAPDIHNASTTHPPSPTILMYARQALPSHPRSIYQSVGLIQQRFTSSLDTRPALRQICLVSSTSDLTMVTSKAQYFPSPAVVLYVITEASAPYYVGLFPTRKNYPQPHSDP